MARRGRSRKSGAVLLDGEGTDDGCDGNGLGGEKPMHWCCCSLRFPFHVVRSVDGNEPGVVEESVIALEDWFEKKNKPRRFGGVGGARDGFRGADGFRDVDVDDVHCNIGSCL